MLYRGNIQLTARQHNITQVMYSVNIRLDCVEQYSLLQNRANEYCKHWISCVYSSTGYNSTGLSYSLEQHNTESQWRTVLRGVSKHIIAITSLESAVFSEYSTLLVWTADMEFGTNITGIRFGIMSFTPKN